MTFHDYGCSHSSSFRLRSAHTACLLLQVLVWAAPEAHLGALEATLRQLMAATLPQGATRAIYVVDAYRCPSFPVAVSAV
jgi:hypothetical protein